LVSGGGGGAPSLPIAGSATVLALLQSGIDWNKIINPLSFLELLGMFLKKPN